MTSTILRRLWIAAIVAFAAFIAWSSLAPKPPIAAPFLPDKVQHFMAYFALALLGSGIVAPNRLWWILIRCVLFGAALEIAQGLMPEGRLAEWGDLAANTAGALTALAIAGFGRAGWGLRALERWRRDPGP